MDTYVPIEGIPEDEVYQNERTISRLDAVKVACIENLNSLKSEEPNRRVGLVTFSDEIKFLGDSTDSNKKTYIAQ